MSNNYITIDHLDQTTWSLVQKIDSKQDDRISDIDIQNWNNKSNFDGDYNSLTNKPPKIHIIELEYYDTIDERYIYSSVETNSEVRTMINNHEIVILDLGHEYYYFQSYDRGVSDMIFQGGFNNYQIMPYKMNNSYTNYWYLNTQGNVYQVLTSGTLIATINGTSIYAPTYTDADGVSY